MNRKYRVIIIVLLSIILMTMFTGCNNKINELAKLKDKDIIDSVDKACNSYFEEKKFVGMSVAIIKDGNVAYLNYGNKSKDGDAVTEDTIYEIASISKTFTGTLLAMESLNDKVALDDPVQKYIEYPMSGEYEGATMTLKHLATHTSGLSKVPNNWRGGPNPYKNYTKEKLDSFMKKNKLTRRPGSVYEYSNLSFGLLGCILEDVENCTFDELLKSSICEPLDMKSTAIFLNEEQQSCKALPYSTADIEGYEWDFDALQACAGVKSTSRDLARYIAANMNQLDVNKELKNAFELAQKIHFNGSPKIGLGWRFAKVGGQTILEHDGLAGGYTSYTAFNTENGVGVVVLCNSADGVIGLGTGIMEILMKQDGK